jgi:flagellar hook assembly protein FlgD
MGAGANLVPWDGRDLDGRPVKSGYYLVSVEALGRRTQALAVER